MGFLKTYLLQTNQQNEESGMNGGTDPGCSVTERVKGAMFCLISMACNRNKKY